MAEISGYRSPVDLGLGQVPLTTDLNIFNEMTEVYNAIHLLNQYLDQLRVVAEGGGGSGQSPADSMPFNRFYVATALVNITAGNPVCPASFGGLNGVIQGALANDFTIAAPTSNFCGIALIDAAIGEDVRVGIGPAILEFPGLVSGQYVWAYSSRATNGNQFNDAGLYIGNPGGKTTGAGTAYPMPVATCPVNGFALFGQYLAL